MDELVKAVQILSRECESHQFCVNCPFLTDEDDCAIQKNPPEDWEPVTIDGELIQLGDKE